MHKRTEATVKSKDGKQFKVTKGAPQVILQLSANAGQVIPAVDKAVNEFAARGFRSLGVAGPRGMAHGSSWAYCPCSIRRGKMPRPPLRPRARWE